MRIRLENVTVEMKGKKILENISMELGEPELVVVLGLNGAGKTTLLRLIAGLIRPSNGKVFFDHEDLSEISDRQKACLLSFLPQLGESCNSYFVEDFVMMGITPRLKFFEVPKNENRKDVQSAMHSVSINHLTGRKMDELSGGEIRLTYLARAIMQNAEYLVLDEPTASLDFKRQYEFFDLLKKMILQKGKGIIVSCHDPNLALKFADQIFIIHDNKLYSQLRKTEPLFKNNYLKVLHEIYGSRLNYLQSEEDNFIYWKDEKNV